MQKSFKKLHIALAFLLGVSILSAAVTIAYNTDRISLNRALQYVYEPDHSTSGTFGINAEALKRTLDNMKANKEDNGRLDRIMSGSRTPYLISYYRWLVLDNLTLTDKKIWELENVFLGRSDMPELDKSQPAIRTNRDSSLLKVTFEKKSI